MFADNSTQKFDVLIIQKSWRNFHVLISYNLRDSNFHLIYQIEEMSKICFYVNKKINSKFWDFQFKYKNLKTLTLSIELEKNKIFINIHNIYNLSFASYTITNNSITLTSLAQILNMSEKYIVIKNFNLHHLYWNDFSKITQYVMTNRFLNLAEKHELNQTLSIDIIIWAKRRFSSIINLMFIIERLKNCLIRCDTASKLNQLFDHISMMTKLLLKTKKTFVRKKKLWKELNVKKMLKIFFEASSSHLRNLNSANEIDDFVKTFTNFIQKFIEVSVFWASLSENSKSYWNKKCQKAVEKTKATIKTWIKRKNPEKWRNFLKTCNKKKES